MTSNIESLEAGGDAPQIQAEESSTPSPRQREDGQQGRNISHLLQEENVELQRSLENVLRSPETSVDQVVIYEGGDEDNSQTDEREETFQTMSLENALHSPEFFVDQVVVSEEEDDVQTDELAEMFEAMSVQSMEDPGMIILVTNGQEMVQGYAEQEVIMACQLCGRKFEGNHPFQVTHCHECDRFKDHGPYNALPHWINIGPSLNII